MFIFCFLPFWGMCLRDIQKVYTELRKHDDASSHLSSLLTKKDRLPGLSYCSIFVFLFPEIVRFSIPGFAFPSCEDHDPQDHQEKYRTRNKGNHIQRFNLQRVRCHTDVHQFLIVFHPHAPDQEAVGINAVRCTGHEGTVVLPRDNPQG